MTDDTIDGRRPGWPARLGWAGSAPAATTALSMVPFLVGASAPPLEGLGWIMAGFVLFLVGAFWSVGAIVYALVGLRGARRRAVLAANLTLIGVWAALIALLAAAV